MSITFHIAGKRIEWEDEDTFVNTSAHVARGIFAVAKLSVDERYGEHPASDFAARLRRALWPENLKTTQAPIAPEVDPHSGGARFVDGSARAPGFIEMRVRQILKICESAPEGATLKWE